MITKMFFNKSQNLSFRIIDSQAVILNTDDSRLHTLNEVGTFIWELLDGKHTAEHIVEEVCEEFDISKKIAEKDVTHFIEDLMRRKLVSAKK